MVYMMTQKHAVYTHSVCLFFLICSYDLGNSLLQNREKLFGSFWFFVYLCGEI